MKNRKTVIVAFLLVAVMLLGVGYAALTDTLTIIGNAHIDLDVANKTFDDKLYFSAAVAGNLEDAASCSGDDATFTANKLANEGDQATFTFTITNDYDLDATITAKEKKLSGVDNPSNSNPQKFQVDYAYPQGKTITADGGTITVVVTVTLREPVTSATSATFGIELTAETVDP